MSPTPFRRLLLLLALLSLLAGCQSTDQEKDGLLQQPPEDDDTYWVDEDGRPLEPHRSSPRPDPVPGLDRTSDRDYRTW
jgi:hypothetical protein